MKQTKPRSRRIDGATALASAAVALLCAATSALATPDATRQSRARELVRLATADAKAQRMALATFRLAQAEQIAPDIPVPTELSRALTRVASRERTLIERGELALRADKTDEVRAVLQQLTQEDSQSAAALEFMLRANAALTRQSTTYHRHRWYATRPVSPAHTTNERK